MKIVAIIHARGGSKRIPLKNIQVLGGKPLLAYPIELAKALQDIDRVIVSTDHPKIREIALEHGAEVPFVRPADISEDVPSELVT
jgi:CMP-N-acetylneuraminic acid synthetase